MRCPWNCDMLSFLNKTLLLWSIRGTLWCRLQIYPLEDHTMVGFVWSVFCKSNMSGGLGVGLLTHFLSFVPEFKKMSKSQIPSVQLGVGCFDLLSQYLFLNSKMTKSQILFVQLGGWPTSQTFVPELKNNKSPKCHMFLGDGVNMGYESQKNKWPTSKKIVAFAFTGCDWASKTLYSELI